MVSEWVVNGKNDCRMQFRFLSSQSNQKNFEWEKLVNMKVIRWVQHITIQSSFHI